MRSRTIGALTVTAALGGLSALQLVPGDSSPLSPRPALAGELVRYDSCTPLLASVRAELQRTAGAYGYGERLAVDLAAGGGGFGATGSGSGSGSGGGSTSGAAVPAPVAPEGGADSGAVGNGDTGTNLQEKGVDEPDVVKLSKGMLLTVKGDALRVVRADAQPRELGRLALPAAPYGRGPVELLVAGDRVLLLDHGSRPGPGAETAGEVGSASTSGSAGNGSATSTTGGEVRIMPAPVPGGYYGGGGPGAAVPTTVLRLADISDPAAPRWVESYEVDGSVLSARLVDGSVRLVTRSTPVLPPVVDRGPQPVDQRSFERQQVRLLAQQKALAASATLAQVLPQAVRRNASGEVLSSGAAVACDDVAYAAGTPGASTLLVTTLRPADGLQPVDRAGVQADGELVYATADRLFVATSRWGTTMGTTLRAPDGQVSTQVHSFDTTDPQALSYVGTGSVDGYVYGRWALSWHEGSLRVATTTGAPWGGGASTSQSSLHVLREADGTLRQVGRLDGLGKGETIQSVRYLGDLATVVTFRQTDPLYVLDLAEPARPQLLGELKVPGFSTYLHPIGDDRLLGIGMEADPRTGRTTGVQASVFDLSDLSAPRQVDRLQLGRGWSVALQESRAFGYDPARRLAVMPFGDDRGGAYGIGLRVAEDGTLTLGGKLRVTPDSQSYGHEVLRAVLDGERVHLLTHSGVVTATSDGFARTGSISLD